MRVAFWRLLLSSQHAWPNMLEPQRISRSEKPSSDGSLCPSNVKCSVGSGQKSVHESYFHAADHHYNRSQFEKTLFGLYASQGVFWNGFSHQKNQGVIYVCQCSFCHQFLALIYITNAIRLYSPSSFLAGSFFHFWWGV